MLHNRDFKSQPTDIKKDSEKKKKERPESNSDDYDTIRKLVEGSEKTIDNNFKHLMYIIAMAEKHANSSEHTLIDGLSFKLVQTAS